MRSRLASPETTRRIFFATERPDVPSLRYLIFWLLRRKKVGEDNGCELIHGERRCFDATDEGYCASCPLGYLDDHCRGENESLISGADQLSFALQQGFTVRLDEVDFRVFRALRILQEERQKFAEEEQQNAQSGNHNLDQRRHGISEF